MPRVASAPKTYDRPARTLARWHRKGAEPDLQIYSFPDPREQVVRLVEVSRGFPESGEVIPFTLGKSAEFPFKSSVILVTPGEWQRIRKGDLSLPSGWDLTEKEKV